MRSFVLPKTDCTKHGMLKQCQTWNVRSRDRWYRWQSCCQSFGCGPRRSRRWEWPLCSGTPSGSDKLVDNLDEHLHHCTLLRKNTCFCGLYIRATLCHYLVKPKIKNIRKSPTTVPRVTGRQKTLKVGGGIGWHTSTAITVKNMKT